MLAEEERAAARGSLLLVVHGRRQPVVRLSAPSARTATAVPLLAGGGGRLLPAGRACQSPTAPVAVAR